MPRFRSIDRESDLATPILIQACLPEGHLARYLVEIVESLDLSAIAQRYAGRGHEVYPPSVLLALLIYAYATRIFSSRKIERATYDSIPFRYMVCNLQLLILVPSVTQDVNDKQQIEPAVEHLGALPQGVARSHSLMADNGYRNIALL